MTKGKREFDFILWFLFFLTIIIFSLLWKQTLIEKNFRVIQNQEY
jgi:preprotein translocase subunit SecG